MHSLTPHTHTTTHTAHTTNIPHPPRTTQTTHHRDTHPLTHTLTHTYNTYHTYTPIPPHTPLIPHTVDTRPHAHSTPHTMHASCMHPTRIHHTLHMHLIPPPRHQGPSLPPKGSGPPSSGLVVLSHRTRAVLLS